MRRILTLLLAAALLTVLGGCALYDKDYEYSEPFTGRLEPAGGNALEIRNYSMLKAALLDMINNRRPSGELRFSSYNGNVSDDLAAVCFEIKSVNPLGVYAVDTISYDTSRIVSYYIAEISITYRRSAEEIGSIHTVAASSDLAPYLREQVLTERAERAVLRTYAPQIDENSILGVLEELYLEDPAELVLPVEAEIESFPREGSSRIFDIALRYPLTEERRSAMSGVIRSRAEALCALVAAQEPETAAETALECARALCDSLRESARGSYGSSLYGALVERSADSQGLALAYCVLCRALGLECMVVEGSAGAMGSEEHYWNILTLDGENYHVDISRFTETPELSFLADDDAFWGVYIWDTERYPACSGTLRYTDLVPPKEEEEEEAAGTAAPGEPGAPEEPDPAGETPEEPPQSGETPPETPPEQTQEPSPDETPEAPAGEEPPEEPAPSAGDDPGTDAPQTESSENSP